MFEFTFSNPNDSTIKTVKFNDRVIGHIALNNHGQWFFTTADGRFLDVTVHAGTNEQNEMAIRRHFPDLIT